MTVCIGSKIMLTNNICTELGLANGTIGTVHNIILPPNNAHTVPSLNAIICTIPPVILFEPDEKCNALESINFPGILKPGIIPIFATDSTFRIEELNQLVTRKQLPIQGGYAFTDYKIQGLLNIFKL
jgi:hypothetical protein